MSELKEKSKFNIQAAELLQDKSLFAPSVHCSYYSCLQLMKVVINEFLETSFEELEKNIKDAQETQKLNTHTYIIKIIGDNIRNGSREKHAIFDRNIKALKRFRISSDYENVQITTSESDKAFNIAKDIRAQLKEIFHV
jgi:hypothetical protein